MREYRLVPDVFDNKDLHTGLLRFLVFGLQLLSAEDFLGRHEEVVEGNGRHGMRAFPGSVLLARAPAFHAFFAPSTERNMIHLVVIYLGLCGESRIWRDPFGSHVFCFTF